VVVASRTEERHANKLYDLMRYRKTVVSSVHQCCGSPFAPFEPTRRVGSVRWGGVRLADVLADCHPSAAAKYIWSYGADSGEFSGVLVDAFIKDLPIARIQAEVLISYELNGSMLPAEHGFPARLVVPGFYGTNSVKWLTRIKFSESRAPGPFTTRWYNDPVLDSSGHETGETTPVWSVAPESVIVSPIPDETVQGSTEREIWGWAWADGGVRSVYVLTGGTAKWQLAELEMPREYEWQRFSIHWTAMQRGAMVLASRAEAIDGRMQPISGRRNAIHQVPVIVL
jgi:DMSO/TMAO reductase YedYZ molybdopterin-dependent catalytic subunit